MRRRAAPPAGRAGRRARRSPGFVPRLERARAAAAQISRHPRGCRSGRCAGAHSRASARSTCGAWGRIAWGSLLWLRVEHNQCSTFSKHVPTAVLQCKLARPPNEKAPRLAGLSLMRRRGLEPPPGYPGPGPQPGASTNSAIGARETASIALGRRAFESVQDGRYISRTHVRSIRSTRRDGDLRRPAVDIGKDLTKRQQEIFDFIKKYSAKYGYPPTVRDIGKAVGLASS